MRAGLAAETTAYTSLAEDLASHGYEVVGFDAPYRTIVVVLLGGRVIERTPQNDADTFSGSQQEQVATRLVQAWSADMGFALDQLERLNASDLSERFFGRLDMQRVGVFGHSLGGATALQFCHDDTRCKAGIDLDWAPLGTLITEGVTQPFMFLLSDHRNESDAEKVAANIASIYDRLPSNLRKRMIVLPPVAVIERLCAESVTRAQRKVFALLTEGLDDEQRTKLDRLLEQREGSPYSTLAWLRTPPGAPTPRAILGHIERLSAIRHLGLPPDAGQKLHQNRLLQLACEAGQTAVYQSKSMSRRGVTAYWSH